MQYDQVIHNLLDRTKSRSKKKKKERRLKFLAAFFFLFYFLHVRECYIISIIIIIIIIRNIIIIIIIRNTLWVLFAFVIMLRHFIKQRKNKQKKIRENFFVSTSRVKI